MPDVLNIEEIKKRHDGEWVLMDDLVTDEGPILRAARVLFHSKDRNEVEKHVRALKPKRFAVLYFGPYPEHMVLNI